MHECETCGLYCDCDGEDLDQPAPRNCICSHEGSGLDTSGNPIDDDDDSDCCHHGVGFDEECEDCLLEEEEEDAK